MNAKFDGLFEINKKKDNLVNLFVNNMNILITGRYESNSSDLLLANDAIIEGVYKRYRCTLEMMTKEIGPGYVYNIKKNEREQDLKKIDLCNGKSSTNNSEEVSKFVQDYMSRLEPMDIDESPIDYENSIKFLDDIMPISNDLYEGHLHLYRDYEVTFKFIGTKDENDKFHGYGVIKFIQSQTCFKGICDTFEYNTLRGSFKHGVPNGLISITSENESLLTMMTLKDGIIHGMVITYGVPPNQFDYPKFRYYAKKTAMELKDRH